MGCTSSTEDVTSPNHPHTIEKEPSKQLKQSTTNSRFGAKRISSRIAAHGARHSSKRKASPPTFPAFGDIKPNTPTDNKQANGTAPIPANTAVACFLALKHQRVSSGTVVNIASDASVARLMYDAMKLPTVNALRPLPQQAQYPYETIASFTDWVLEGYYYVCGQHFGVSSLLTDAGVFFRTLCPVIQKLASKFPFQLDECLEEVQYVRQSAERVFSGASNASLEMETRKLSPKVPPNDANRVKQLVGLLCLLGQAAVRLAFLACGLAPEDDTFTEGLQSAVGICENAYALSSLPLEYFTPFTITDIAAIMWNVSYPREHRVFLSHRGADIKAQLRDRISQVDGSAAEETKIEDASGSTTNSNHTTNSTASSASCSGSMDEVKPQYPAWFLDCMFPPIDETNRGFIWREMWECTSFHSFITQNYWDSPWCRLEIRGWNLMQKLQRWRLTTHSISSPEIQTPAEFQAPDLGKQIKGELSALIAHGPRTLATPYLLVRHFNQLSRTQWFGLIQFTYEKMDGPVNAADRAAVWQRVLDSTVVAVSCTLHHADASICDNREIAEALVEMLSATQKFPPGDALCQKAVTKAAMTLCNHQVPATALWLTYLTHRQLNEFYGLPRIDVRLTDLLNRLPQLVGNVAMYSLILNKEEADHFYAMMNNPDVDRKLWLVRDITPMKHMRLVLCGFLIGVAAGRAQLLQLRGQPITDRTAAGIRLGTLPCVSAGSWEEIDNILKFRYQRVKEFEPHPIDSDLDQYWIPVPNTKKRALSPPERSQTLLSFASVGSDGQHMSE